MQDHSVEKLAHTIPEAAHALGLGRTKIYELIGTNSLRTVKVGRRTLIVNVREYLGKLKREAGHVEAA